MCIVSVSLCADFSRKPIFELHGQVVSLLKTLSHQSKRRKVGEDASVNDVHDSGTVAHCAANPSSNAFHGRSHVNVSTGTGELSS